MSDITIKQHDLWPPLALTLSDKNGRVDLTTASSIKLLLKLQTGATLIAGTCVNVESVNGAGGTDPSDGKPVNRGKVTYSWTAGDTDILGDYKLEVEVTWPTAKPQTFPNTGTKTLTIEGDLG